MPLNVGRWFMGITSSIYDGKTRVIASWRGILWHKQAILSNQVPLPTRSFCAILPSAIPLDGDDRSL